VVAAVLISIACVALAIALAQREMSASGLVAMAMLLCIELFIFSIIGWSMALLVWAAMTVSFTVIGCMFAEVAHFAAKSFDVPRSLRIKADPIAIQITSILSAFASLWLLSRASQVPHAGIFDGLKWIAGIFTPGPIVLVLMVFAAGTLYNRVMDRKESSEVFE
jgi:hypothetical protein